MLNSGRGDFCAANDAYGWVIAVNLMQTSAHFFAAIKAFIPMLVVIRRVCLTLVVLNAITSV